MTSIRNLIALSATCKSAYDDATDPDTRRQLLAIGEQVAAMIGKMLQDKSKQDSKEAS